MKPDISIKQLIFEPHWSIITISGGFMAEHIMHKKENKKAPQKTLKEKREDKKNKKKGSTPGIPQ